MVDHIYQIENENETLSPALIYYYDIIKENTKKAIDLAGGADRLWPHVKSHKMRDMVSLQQGLGINRFKCATIAEAEMTARCRAAHILLSYPLVGPNIDRFVSLCKNYTQSKFWAIGDDLNQLYLLGQAALAAKITIPVLIDVNMGMNRTGVPFNQLQQFSLSVSSLEGLSLKGYHCYDGHLGISDPTKRQNKVEEAVSAIQNIRIQLENSENSLPVLVMGGSPTFPCHAKYNDVFLSPGTLFINDNGYSTRFPDLDFIPAAAIMARVISRPEKGLFTLDLGYKGIASDSPAENRGIIVEFPDAKPVIHSEEHWVFSLAEEKIPPIGTVLYVIPTHICPTTALYNQVLVASNSKLINTWTVDARNRKLTL